MKWRKTCTGLKFDLDHFYGPQIKFLFDSLYEHPVDAQTWQNVEAVKNEIFNFRSTLLLMLLIAHTTN